MMSSDDILSSCLMVILGCHEQLLDDVTSDDVMSSCLMM